MKSTVVVRNKSISIGIIFFLMLFFIGCSPGGWGERYSEAEWEVLPDPNGYIYAALSDFTPAGESVLYSGSGSAFYEYGFPTNGNPDGYFYGLASAPGIDSYTSFAWYDGYLYTAQSNSIYRYNIMDDSWTALRSGLSYSINMAQSTADDYGYVYAVTSGGDYLLEYDAVYNELSYISTPGLSNSEPRAAWDSLTQRVYLADYTETFLYAFDPTDNSFIALEPFPYSYGVSDAFCSDRRGHIFTTNGSGSGNEVWRYTALTDSWEQIQSLPFAPGSSAVCTVSADGYLYIGDSSTHFARLRVF